MKKGSTAVGCLVVIVLGVIFMNYVTRPEQERPAGEKTQQDFAEAEQRMARGDTWYDDRAVHDQAVKHRETFMLRLSDDILDRNLISHVDVLGKALRIHVGHGWSQIPNEEKASVAQSLWELWASIVSPDQRDDATIIMVDGDGDRVGGSMTTGSDVQIEPDDSTRQLHDKAPN